MADEDDGIIKIFTTGGSLDKYYDLHCSDLMVGPPQVGQILIGANVTTQFEVQEFIRKDSLEITPEEREQLKALISADNARRIIVVHGTDTMHLTGQVLSEIKGKVIVLTGAMQPATFKDTDAPFNVGCAFLAAQTLTEGTYLVMNGCIFDPFQTKKNIDLKRFEHCRRSLAK